MQSKKKISVVLPVYNGGALLVQSVESVLLQDYNEYEFLICDDCSTDGSFAYLQKLSSAYPDIIKLFKNEKNQGLFYTLNYLIANVSTNLIKLWSQDDIMKPICLENIVAFHKKHTHISMSYHKVDYIDNADNIIELAPEDGTPEIITDDIYIKTSLKWGCMPGNIANVTLVKRYLDQIGSFDVGLKVSGDFEMWSRLVELAPIGRLDESLILLRRHLGQLSRRYSSILYSIEEDLVIYNTLLSRLNYKDLPRFLKIFYWRTLVIFFNEAVFLISKGEFDLAFKSFSRLHQSKHIFTTFMRWSYIRLLRVLKKDSIFYSDLYR